MQEECSHLTLELTNFTAARFVSDALNLEGLHQCRGGCMLVAHSGGSGRRTRRARAERKSDEAHFKTGPDYRSYGSGYDQADLFTDYLFNMSDM